jgi:hypothetical protein
MQFTGIIVMTAVAASTAYASWATPPTPRSLNVAGHVITDKAVTYQMTNLNEIKVFDNKVNGEYPHPVVYKVEAGYHCNFYR